MTASPRLDLTALWRMASVRLTSVVMSLFLVASLAIVGAMYWAASDLLLQQVVDDVAQRGSRLSRDLVGASGPESIRIVSARAASGQGVLYLLATGDTRQRLAGNLGAWPDGVVPDGRTDAFTLTTASGAHLAVGLAYRLPSGLLLLVAREATAQATLTRRLRWIVLGGSLLVLVFAGLVALALRRFVMQRISAITRAGDRFMQGDLAERVPLTGAEDELDELSARLNLMFERIGQLMTGMREVSDNIAHDLKTPLNRLRNRAEGALASGTGIETQRAALEDILAETDTIIRTFNALLQVARLEAGAMDHLQEPFDLTALVRDAVELYEPVAEEAGAVLTMGEADPVVLRGNRQLLGQAITNLIENALKYGVPPPGTSAVAAGAPITVSLRRADGAVIVEVADRGPGIAPEDRENALKRFVRLDQSRSKPGTGLGLSLVAAVARGHGGSVELLDNRPGLAAQLRLPNVLLAGQTDQNTASTR